MSELPRSGFYQQTVSEENKEAQEQVMVESIGALIDKGTRLEARNVELLAALHWFWDDPRFKVSVGGNPMAIEELFADTAAILAKAEETP